MCVAAQYKPGFYDCTHVRSPAQSPKAGYYDCPVPGDKSPQAPGHTASGAQSDRRGPPPPYTPPGGWSYTSSCPSVHTPLCL